MRDLASLTAADFVPVVGSDFEVLEIEAGGPLPDESSERLRLRLAEVVELPEGEAGFRRPFSLRFRGPRHPLLGQLTHRLGHEQLGEMEVFLGPIAADADGTTYEAVFG